MATVTPPAVAPSAKLLARRTAPWLTAKAVVKVLAPEITRRPMSPLVIVWEVALVSWPESVRVLPGMTRISLPALSVRKLRVEVKVSVARKWPPWMLMILAALPRAPSLETASTPVLMLTVPVKSLVALVSSIVPAPFFWIPKPNAVLETLPEKIRPNGWKTVEALTTLR